ncbi:hypothetical protein TL16_g07508 [Triparma laevis f. inornata]|uniref:Uncharacterized protein n=1 Tax=Triparma laevis f. inornata TaxID=1714386 RepID=A0A9W7AR84_9STRA|nr:hypothetical protein TL16_g07508 [Triparma laevis f. inornata]
MHTSTLYTLLLVLLPTLSTPFLLPPPTFLHKPQPQQPLHALPTPQITSPPPPLTSTTGLILVDSFSPYHGTYLSSTALEKYNATIINLYSPYVQSILLNQPDLPDSEITRIQSHGIPSTSELDSWVEKCGVEITSIICESDSGLRATELLASSLNLSPERSNDVGEWRRDKSLMYDHLKQTTKMPETLLCRSKSEARAFASSLGCTSDGSGSSVVVKPKRGVASGDVYRCGDIEKVERCVERILGSEVFGEVGKVVEDVLVQEVRVMTYYINKYSILTT